MATRETKHSVNIVIKAFDKASSKFRKIAIAGKAMVFTFGKNVIAGTFRFLSNIISNIIKQIKRLIKITAVAMVAINAWMVAIGAGFEKTMSRVKALTGATKREFKALERTAKELGETTEFTASQVAAAMSELAIAGFKTKEIITAIPSILNLASAGGLELAESADILTGIMGGMGLKAKELGGIVDILAKGFTTSRTDLVMLGEAMKTAGPIAKQTGKDMTEVVAVLMSLANANFRGQEGGTALRNILINLSNTSGATAKAIKKLVSSVKDANGNMRPSADIIDEMNASLSRLDKVDQTALLMEAFGKRAGPAMAGLLDRGAQSVRDYEKALKDVAGTAKNIARIQLDNLAGSVTKLRSQIEGLALEIFDFHKVQMKEFVDSIRRSIAANRDTIIEWALTVSSKLQLVKDILIGIVDFIRTDWKAGIEFGFDAVIILAKGFADSLRNIFAEAIFPSAKEMFARSMRWWSGPGQALEEIITGKKGKGFIEKFWDKKVQEAQAAGKVDIDRIIEKNKDIARDAITKLEAALPSGLAESFSAALLADQTRIAMIKGEIAKRQLRQIIESAKVSGEWLAGVFGFGRKAPPAAAEPVSGALGGIIRELAKERKPLAAEESRFLTMAGRRDPAVEIAKNTLMMRKSLEKIDRGIKKVVDKLDKPPIRPAGQFALVPSNF